MAAYWGTARREKYALAKGIWPEGGDLGAALWWESAYRSGGHSGAPRQRYCHLTTLARPTHCRRVPSGSPGSGYREAWQRVGED
jgi:hypothetical protein